MFRCLFAHKHQTKGIRLTPRHVATANNFPVSRHIKIDSVGNAFGRAKNNPHATKRNVADVGFYKF